MPATKTRIVFADDHELVRAGMRTLFQSAPYCTLVGEAGDGEQAIRLIARHKPDVAILDLSMPKVNGIEAVRIVKEQHPKTKVLILTMYEDEGYVSEMIRAGADGYVLKNADKKEILSAIKAVASGRQFFSPTISKMVTEDFGKKSATKKRGGGKSDRLTRRETEVLRFIVKGLTSQKIADRLSVSLNTVQTHRANIMKKLRIHDKAGLVKYALQSGLTAFR